MENEAMGITGEAFLMLGLAWIMIVLRTVARATSVGIKNFQLDDYLMPFAGIAYAIEITLVYLILLRWKNLSNNVMSAEQRAALDPASEEFRLRVGGSKTQVTAWVAYSFIIWALKLCMCVFYARLTNGLTHMKIRIRVGYVLIGATYLIVVLTILFGCHPLAKYWQIHPAPGNRCEAAVSRINLLVTLVFNVLTDAYLISIPLPLLWAAQMNWRKKGLLLAIFGGGFFVIACGILRCALVLADPVAGPNQSTKWAFRELCAAIIIDNLPIVYPLCAKWFRKASTSIGGSSTSRNKLSHERATKDSHQMQSLSSKRSKFMHPLSLRNITPSDSSENIVNSENLKVGGGRATDILVVKESSVETSAKEPDDDILPDSFQPHPLPHRASVRYVASCKPSRQPSQRDLTV